MKNEMTSRPVFRVGSHLALVALVAIGWTSDAAAWEQYSVASDATNCAQCHGDFRASPYVSMTDGTSWGDDLHDVHRNDMLAGDCNTCHTTGGRFPVLMDSSTGGTGLATVSCMGCHGRAEDDVPANPATPAMGGAGAGLRQHHATAGVTMCADCHADANPASYTPVGEEVLPPFYATPGTGHPAMPVDSCNPVGSEDFAATALGLDNDGDGVFDGSDTDCMMAVDAGTDAGPMDSDAGMMDPDAGMMDSDAGMMVVDAGPSASDAGAAGGDAGPPVEDGGCGCTVASTGNGGRGAALIALGAFFLLFRRRR